MPHEPVCVLTLFRPVTSTRVIFPSFTAHFIWHGFRRAVHYGCVVLASLLCGICIGALALYWEKATGAADVAATTGNAPRHTNGAGRYLV